MPERRCLKHTLEPLSYAGCYRREENASETYFETIFAQDRASEVHLVGAGTAHLGGAG